LIVYSATKARFQEDVMTNDIGGIIFDAFQTATGRSTSKSEIQSWMQSLQYMDRVLNDDEIPHDASVAIEYHLPQTSKRIDFILTGQNRDRRESAILVELKQWQKAEMTQSDAIVITRFKHGHAETLHPSYQAWSYKRLLEDFNQTVQEEHIQLYPCAYLHNYEDDGVITNPFYGDYLKKAPVFLKPDALKLQQFIKTHVKYGDTTRIMYRIEHGKIKPSKNLADELASMLHGNRGFVLIDDQKVVFEKAKRLAQQTSERDKKVLIIKGGPGTGKSVLAINLLVALGQKLVVQYVTRNSAPRLVYEAKLTGSFKKSHISNLFSGSGSFHAVQPNVFDCLVVDEAHRLNEKSGMFSHLGENQIKEIINASKLSVFFIDEDQKVTLKDIGDRETIRVWAEKLGAEAVEASLESQFRCNGSNGYLAWLDNTLQIRETANETLDPREYDFRIVDSPAELHELIRTRNKKNNKARMVAGYCWDWTSKKQPMLKDIIIGDYKATWNLDTDGQAWIIKPDSVSEVGCIHTCQGLEVDYIGVIVGPDLIVRDSSVITRPAERSKMDKSIQGWKKLVKDDPEVGSARLDAIIKNTYRTLMTRGQKGCYVYFVDDETRRFFANRLQDGPEMEAVTEKPVMPKHEEAELVLPFRRLGPDEARPYENCVPLYDLKIAAGGFSDEQQIEDCDWVELPEEFRPRKGLFVAQVMGESMNRRIPNGAWCLFREEKGGSRNGKVVLASHREIADTDTGGHYTVKTYESTKESLSNGTWQHTSIILRPDSSLPGFEPIVLSEEQSEDLRVVGELVAVLG
jgi:DUF2075 family protein